MQAARDRSNLHPVTRYGLMALLVLILVGLVVSFLPNPARAPLGEVLLEGVELELFPAADPDARWVFKASTVRTNPDTRESVAKLEGDGVRYIKGKPDLYLRASEVTIDGNDNLRMQEAKIYIPKDCIVVKLGQPSGGFVVVDQNAGYSAPFADVVSLSFSIRGPNFNSDFAFEKVKVSNDETTTKQGGKKPTCEQIRSRMGFLNVP